MYNEEIAKFVEAFIIKEMFVLIINVKLIQGLAMHKSK